MDGLQLREDSKKQQVFPSTPGTPSCLVTAAGPVMQVWEVYKKGYPALASGIFSHGIGLSRWK